jgi:hypothetical protein
VGENESADGPDVPNRIDVRYRGPKQGTDSLDDSPGGEFASCCGVNLAGGSGGAGVRGVGFGGLGGLGGSGLELRYITPGGVYADFLGTIRETEVPHCASVGMTT